MSTIRFPTKRQFAAWRKQHPDAGKHGSGYTCPLAVYLREHGAPWPYVDEDCWHPDCKVLLRERKWHELPKWAREYVAYYDSYECDPPGLIA